MALHLLVQLGTEPGTTVLWLALLLTCSAHAAMWAALAALFARRKSLSAATRHWCWKMALFGPLATTSLAAAIPRGVERALEDASYLQEISVLSLADVPASTVPGPEPRAGASTGERASVEAPPWRAQGSQPWRLLAACGAGAAALGLLRFTASAMLLWRRLRGRKEVHDARWLQRLERMRTRVGLRRVVLTESARVGSPLVMGTSEICLPAGRLRALTDAEIDAVLAHELAHLERRDGLWFPAVGLVQSVLWMQPINHWVSSRFRQTAELACDDRAVELTGDPLGLARALIQVAAGALLAREGAMVPTMACPASALRARVERLADAGSRTEFQASRRGRPWALAGLAAAGFATAGLSVQAVRARPSQPAWDARAEVARSPEAALDATEGDPPDAAEMSEQMADLSRREQQLVARLEAASSQPGAQGADTQASVMVLELSQELRHVRAAKAWIEERFVDEWTTWERRRGGSGTAPR
ncbi:M56 family metallopeptidase [Sorangium sp. So ce260]|uniref:M56 family metallopeptidase n=1 Tax=Sorangium sp. So ce260 TaxID=3133291 RepID=UPI003F5DE653